MSRATVVTIFHRTDDPRDFTAVAAELRETAAGATDLRVSILDRPHLDWGIAVSFSDPESRWPRSLGTPSAWHTGWERTQRLAPLPRPHTG